ncbi:MAG: hypothetical protein IPP93_11775 [Chitinophagaceae bacterium]|nr:hypothetical protein [Chitinophagaceae bacterium]MBL0334658.1 hypothetical protein [Chitinophagaceae bacterium]
MKRLQFLLVMFLAAGTAMAQDNSFLLYSLKGNVSVVDNKVETKAKVGQLLKSSANLKIAPGGMATLICNQASMFTVNKAGNYSLNKFKDSCREGSNNVSANYIKYVWNQMTSHGEGSPGSNRKAFMNTVGAVSRSINNIWIDPRLDTVNYTAGDFPLSWKSYTDAGEFQFSLYNSSNIADPFYTQVTSKSKIMINSFATKIKEGSSYYWTSAVKGEENDELKVLNFVSKDTYDKLVSLLKTQGGAGEAPAEQAYRIAFMLEDAHYLAEAYQYYSKAAQLAPDNVLYRSTLMSFKKDYEIK